MKSSHRKKRTKIDLLLSALAAMNGLKRILRPGFASCCIFLSLLFVMYVYYILLSKSNWTTRFIASVSVQTSSLRLRSKSNAFLPGEVGSRRDNVEDPSSDSGQYINVMFLFNEARNSKQLQINFKMCISSLLSRATKRLILHITGDIISFQIAKKIIHNLFLDEIIKEIVYHDKTEMPAGVFQTISNVHEQLSAVIHHFSDPLFYISLVMHRIMPVNITRLILLDVDIIFQSDIAELFSLFDSFQGDQVIGIAKENQPVYRNVFWNYRKKHPDTRIGGPPPNGLTGFNSGVVLFELEKLRQSSKYNSFLIQDNLISLVRKYDFKGHLGDQDFFTLLSFECESLFYILPCGWNRQLCTWWQRDEFIPIFNKYFYCSEPVHILHGNCNTSEHR